MELAPFGIEVADLQPGGVQTAMTEFPEDEEETAWAAIPPGLRQAYRERFVHPGQLLRQEWAFETPEAFAERVYRKIVTARRLRPVYVLGRGVGPLPLLHRMLPRAAVEWIWRRAFRVGRPAR